MAASSSYARDAETELALNVIRGVTRSWEQQPDPFVRHDEPELRTILVGSLNGAFQGRVTAESYNGRGKTDIMVRAGADNVLLAECKLYNGPNGIVDAVDQLLGYATWRDRQLCLLIFVRSAAITRARAALDTAASRIAHILGLDQVDADGAEFLLHGHRRDDPDLSVEVRVLLVHIKVPRSQAGRRASTRKSLHPDDLAETLLDLARTIPPDAGMEYSAEIGEGADEPPLDGWSVRWSRVARTGPPVGIRAWPTTPSATREHGPKGCSPPRMTRRPEVCSARFGAPLPTACALSSKTCRSVWIGSPGRCVMRPIALSEQIPHKPL